MNWTWQQCVEAGWRGAHISYAEIFARVQLIYWQSFCPQKLGPFYSRRKATFVNFLKYTSSRGDKKKLKYNLNLQQGCTGRPLPSSNESWDKDSTRTRTPCLQLVNAAAKSKSSVVIMKSKVHDGTYGFTSVVWFYDRSIFPTIFLKIKISGGFLWPFRLSKYVVTWLFVLYFPLQGKKIPFHFRYKGRAVSHKSQGTRINGCVSVLLLDETI